MKLSSLFNSVEKATIKLSKNQLYSVRGKNIEIHCLYGNLWVTWPNRGERILNGGQTFRVSSRGKVCIVAFSNASFKISKRRWGALLKRPKGWSGPVMTASDCYRFCLSNPHVDLVLTGPKNRRQLQENLSHLREKGLLSEEENRWIRNFGQMVHRSSSRFTFRF